MISRLFQHAHTSRGPSDDHIITVVSGLPRSGTSMMMRMLEAGGLQIMTDSIRLADESNPKGYYEFEPVKQMRTGNTHWIEGCKGKVVKIISPLLQYLPAGYDYRVIFMQRNLTEVLASQREMLIRRGEKADPSGDQSMEEFYKKHLSQVTSWLAVQPNIRALYLHYNQIMENPGPSIRQLVQFIQPTPFNQAGTHSVVEAQLYRQRERRIWRTT